MLQRASQWHYLAGHGEPPAHAHQKRVSYLRGPRQEASRNSCSAAAAGEGGRGASRVARRAPVKRNRPNPQAESDAAQQPLGPAQPSGRLNVRSSSAPLVQLVAQGQPVPQHASHGLGSHALAPLPQPQLLTQSYAHHGGLPEATYRHQESLGNLLALVQGRLDHEIQELNRFKLLVQLFVQEREMWAVRD